MEIIYHGHGHINVGFKERNVWMGGESATFGFLAYINGAEWVSHSRKTPLTAGESVELLRASCGFTWRESAHFIFVDDNSKTIYYSPQGEPYVYIEEGVVKSSKANAQCLCDVYEECDDFPDTQFKRFSANINDHVDFGAFKKVRVWMKRGKYVEGRYQCTRCGKIWRLVSPRDSFRGLWEKV